jgi:hypothetical protein
MFRRYNVTSDADLQAVAEQMGKSMGKSDTAASKTRVVTLRQP